jgi:hypothetical protein
VNFAAAVRDIDPTLKPWKTTSEPHAMNDKTSAARRWFQAIQFSPLTTRRANSALAASHQAQPNSLKAKPECQILVM